MDEMMGSAIKLSGAIKESVLYREYQTSLACILKNPELVSKISRFKKVQLAYESKSLRDGEPSFDEEKYVSKLYSDLCLQDDVYQFLHAECELLRLIRNVHDLMFENYEINTSFLDYTE